MMTMAYPSGYATYHNSVIGKQKIQYEKSKNANMYGNHSFLDFVMQF